MYVFALGWVLGMGCLQQQAELWHPQSWFIIFGLLVVAIIGRMGVARYYTQHLVVLALSFLLAFGWASWRAHDRLSASLPSELEGKDILLTGVIANLPTQFEQGQRFEFEIDTAQLTDTTLSSQYDNVVHWPRRVLLSWYARRQANQSADDRLQDEEANHSTLPLLKPGQQWQLTVRLKRPHGNANPSGFDYEYWLLEQGIRATGYVRDKNQPMLLADQIYRAPIARLRYQLRQRVQSALANQPYAPIITALVLGDQQAITNTDWQRYNALGVSHLIAISGLHVTMVAWLMAGLVSWLWRRSFFIEQGWGRPLPLFLPAQTVAGVAGLLAALFYCLIAGMGVPAQRTLLMLATVVFSMLVKRRPPAGHVLGVALVLVLLFDPWAVLAPGFWLSFVAVGWLMWSGHLGSSSQQKRLEPVAHVGSDIAPKPTIWARYQPHVATVLRAQAAVTLGLIPFTLLLFQQVSLVSPLANGLAIPVISFVVTPLSLVATMLPDMLANPLWQMAHTVFAWLAVWFNYLAQFSWASWQAPQPAWWQFVLATAGIVVLWMPWRWYWRLSGLAYCLPMLLNQAASPPPGTLWMTVLDIGQGMAILIETPTHRLLYDTGPQFNEEANAGSRTILPYLYARGIHHLDGVIVSHRDNDHSGGLAAIAQAIHVGWLRTSIEPSWLAAQSVPLSSTPCQAGQQWQWDTIQFEILHPEVDSYQNTSLKTNARSCVLRISMGNQHILLPGDIERQQERDLLARYSPEALETTILLAPHHGSKTSSSVPFLAMLQPKLVVFQAGYRNRYGHPAKEVVARYQALAIPSARTDQTGALRFRIDATTWQMEAYRQVHARYWYNLSNNEAR